MDNGHAAATNGIRRRASVAGCEVTLTVTEYELLRVLSLAAGRVVTHDELLRRVWRGRSSGDPKRVRAFVKGLRPMTAVASLRAISVVMSPCVPKVTRLERPNARVWTTKTILPLR